MYQLKVNQQQTIVAFRVQGWSKRRIAHELALDRATVRKYLAQADSESPTPQTGSAEFPPPKMGYEPQLPRQAPQAARCTSTQHARSAS